MHGTTPTVFNGSTDEKEPTSQTDGGFHTYFFQVKFTQPGTAEAIKFQFRTLNGAKTVRADSLVILAMRLDADLVDGTDYKYGEDDDTGATTAIEEASFNAFATITFTPGTASEDWLVIGCLNYLIDAGTFYSVLWRINRDSAADTAPFAQEEGENASDSRVNAMSRVYTLTAASHTFTVEAQNESDNADQNDHQFSSIFALRLDVFEDHTFDWTETEFSPSTTGVYEEMTGLASYTPTTAGDNIIVATALSDPGGNNRTAGIRVQLDATTAPVGQDGHDDAGSWDPTDENPMAVLAKANMAASARDIDFDGSVTDVATQAIEDRSIAVWSLELAAGGATTHQLSGAVPLALALSGGGGVRRSVGGTLPLVLAPSGGIEVRRALAGTLPLALTPGGGIDMRRSVAGTLPLTLQLTGALAGIAADVGAVTVSDAPTGALAAADAAVGGVALVDAAHGNLEVSDG